MNYEQPYPNQFPPQYPQYPASYPPLYPPSYPPQYPPNESNILAKILGGLGFICLCVLFYLYVIKEDEIKLIMKGKIGDEQFKITDSDNNIIYDTKTLTTTPETITFKTKKDSIFIHFLNDNGDRDIILTNISKNNTDLALGTHIRGDLFFPNDEPRKKNVLEGNLNWKTTNDATRYQIDLK